VVRMGIYDSAGLNGDPGNKLAETEEITPVVGWNTANVTSPALLQPGTYWLVYLPSSNDLHIRRAGVGRYVDFLFPYAPLPETYSDPTQRGSDHWSFYATGVSPGPVHPIVLGDNRVLPLDDNGNGNLLEAQQSHLDE